jgi:hypothetical protein
MNIVKIQHYGNGGTFLFSVPDGIQLSKNQKVTVLTKYGEKEGTCVEDSMVIDDKVLEYLAAVAQYKLPLKPVLGIWGYQEFEKPGVKEPEVIRLLCVKDLGNNWLTVGKIYESVNGRITVDTGENYTDRYMIEGARLFPLVKRPARVGEWVIDKDTNDICCVIANGGNAAVYVRTLEPHNEYVGSNADRPIEQPFTYLLGCEYEVIDGYNGEYHA